MSLREGEILKDKKRGRDVKKRTHEVVSTLWVGC
jgi:hypothetical protein